MQTPAPAASGLTRMLETGRNPDGGWGYYPGKASRLEPTCWALLALPSVPADVLRSWPVQDGLLLERAGGSPNIAFHALAIVTLLRRGQAHASGNETLVRALEGRRGLTLEPSEINRQDNGIQGWSWIDGTFSWVEPTAWGLLALERWRAAGGRPDETRVTDARRLLADRCCLSGGWNYGNSNMLGKELRPYVPNTAVALLALHGQDTDVVRRSLTWLDGAASGETSGVALALASLALRAYERPIQAVQTALAAQTEVTLTLENQLAAAQTLVALDPEARL